MKQTIPLIKFQKNPEFADLWDACLYTFLYNKKHYCTEILNVFKHIGINKESNILDSCAGTGFIALHLREQGYTLDCMDLMDDEIRVFKRKAQELGVDKKILKRAWKDIPQTYKNKTYDFIFCRGNSFIYADGGWNQKNTISEKSSLNSYKKTLQIFYNQLNNGGYLYIDKFPDNEKPHKDLVAYIQVNNKEKGKLFFYTKKISYLKYREAAMIRRDPDEKESYIPNITYDLKGKQLESMLKEIGFTIKKLKLKSETHFTTWLAQKKQKKK